MQEKPRAYTVDETQEMFIDYIKHLVEYWNENNGTKRECLEGLAFSILTMLDGEAGALPGFKVMPYPHEDDKEYYILKGENYFNPNIDIAGILHDVFLVKCNIQYSVAKESKNKD